MKENIILIGFMGSGKTTVGHIVANTLGFDFIDTDELIEKKANMSISEIFDQLGEEEFRKMESELLVELNNNLSHAVISTGGGLPLREENAALLKTLGVVNYLHVTKEVVISRLKGDTTRPLLAGDHVEEKVEKLLATRNEFYQAASHVDIDAQTGTPEEVANRILEAFKNIFDK